MAAAVVDAGSNRVLWNNARPAELVTIDSQTDAKSICFAFEGYGRSNSVRLGQFAARHVSDDTAVAYPRFGEHSLDTGSIGMQMAHEVDRIQPESVSAIVHSMGARALLEAANYGGVAIDNLYMYESPGTLDDVTKRYMRTLSYSPVRAGIIGRAGVEMLKAYTTKTMPRREDLGLDHSARFTGQQATLLKRPLADPNGALAQADIVHFVGENRGEQPFIDINASNRRWQELDARSYKVRSVRDGTHTNLHNNPYFATMLHAAMNESTQRVAA